MKKDKKLEQVYFCLVVVVINPSKHCVAEKDEWKKALGKVKEKLFPK